MLFRAVQARPVRPAVQVVGLRVALCWGVCYQVCYQEPSPPSTGVGFGRVERSLQDGPRWEDHSQTVRISTGECQLRVASNRHSCYHFPMSDTSVAPEIRRRVLHSHNRFWRPENFDGSPDAVAQALSRLARTGELRRVRRGLYWRGTPTRLGMAPPPADRLANEVVGGPGSGPAGGSAALALGLSTQVPRRETIAVPGRAPRGPDTVRFVSRTASTKRRDERLRPAEVALLEVLREWEALVEISTLTPSSALRLIDTGGVRIEPVVRQLQPEPPRVASGFVVFLAHLVNQVPPRAFGPPEATRFGSISRSLVDR